jgi:serine protease Do
MHFIRYLPGRSPQWMRFLLRLTLITSLVIGLFTASGKTQDITLLQAQQMSVRILTDQGTGSGVLIDQQQQVYTVLTNAHVVAGEKLESTLLTADGQTYVGHWLNQTPVIANDLALVQFTSDRQYPIATFSDLSSDPAQIPVGETLYAVGFPSWQVLSPTQLNSTREQGFQAFQWTTGTLEMLLPKPLEQGYQLGYTNEIVSGMSGGAVLDGQGHLVGINGKLKYPLQGIFAFTFADGTQPSEELFRAMEPLSWAIPITTIRQVLNR